MGQSSKKREEHPGLSVRPAKGAIRRVEITSNKLLTTAFEASLECVLQ